MRTRHNIATACQRFPRTYYARLQRPRFLLFSKIVRKKNEKNELKKNNKQINYNTTFRRHEHDAHCTYNNNNNNTGAAAYSSRSTLST